MFQAIESLETRQLLCSVPHPSGFEPARLTPGMDKFAEGISVTVQQLRHPTLSSRSGNGKSALPENPTYTPDGGTPNLAVLDVFMCDVSGNEVATPAVGSYAYMQVEYSTVNIPLGETYTVRMTVGGQDIDYTLNWGAGGGGTQYWALRLGVWMVTPGFKGASATLDVHNDISESNGGDNTGSCNFNPAVFSGKFAMPLAHTAWTDWTMVNYVDVNLAPNAPGDYAGGTWTYDGHNGWDFTAANWRLPDAGWDIYAAAGGTVVKAVDGNFDRNATAPYPPANYVTIDHGNGFSTTYYHLRLNTVAVEEGDVVVKGQKIGEMGSSGNSTNPHLHWGVYYNGMQVEPGVDYASYFTAATASVLDYANNNDAVLDAGIINGSPSAQMYDGPVTIDNFNPGDTVYLWGVLGGVGVGDDLQVVWRRPDNSVQETDSWASSNEQYIYYWPTMTVPTFPAPPTGTWTATWSVNGVNKATRSFTVQTGSRPAEARMTETDGTYIIDNRSTPFDLGSVLQGDTSGLPAFSFRVRNDGESALTTSGLTVPFGYTVTNGLAASIAAGSFDTVTMQLDSGYDGTHAGYVSFNTSDADAGENLMRFRVTGKVNKLQSVAGNLVADDEIYVKRSGSDARIWVNTSTANPPTYELPATELDDVTFYGYGGNDRLTVDFSAGNPLGGTVLFAAGPDDDTLRAIGSGGDESFITGGNGFTVAGVTANETNLEELDIEAGGGDDTLVLNLAGLFDDLDAITNHTSFDGQAGNDFVGVNDTYDNVGRDYLVNPTSVTRDGSFGGLTYWGTEALTLNSNNVASTIQLNGGISLTTTDWAINGNDGWDVVNVGNSSIESINGALTVNGGDGLDFINVNNNASVSPDAINVGATMVTHAGFGGLSYAEAEGLFINAQNVAAPIFVNGTAQFTPVAVNAGGGNDAIHVLGNFDGAEVLVSSGDGDDTLNVNTDAIGTARVRLNSSETFGHVNIGSGGGVRMDANGSRVLRAAGLMLSGNAFIDLADNDMIIDYGGASPIATVQAQLASGYAGGAWTGAGIRSSSAAAAPGKALGYAEAADLFAAFPATFSGQPVDDTAVCVKYTLAGDANLSGEVNLQDFNRLASNFGTSGKRWSQGDFNYDGNVNLQDFNRLAANFGQGGFGPDALPTTGGKSQAQDEALPEDWLELIDA